MFGFSPKKICSVKQVKNIVMVIQLVHLFSKLEHLLTGFVVLSMLAGCPLEVTSSSYSHYRLPATIQPDSYHLKIITHLNAIANFTFDGHVSIRFHALEDSNNITLHVQNLNVDDSRIQLKSYDDEEFRLCLQSIDTVPEHDYYIIRLCENLNKGQVYKLQLDFSGILNQEMRGYFRSSYVDKVTNETRWLSVTQFEPTSARAAFPCLDEPNYKAKFIIWLGHHKSLTALSNMPQEKQTPLDGLNDFVWSIFEESLYMSTYLVAYTVNDFIYKESSVEGSDVIFRTWSRRDKIDQCDYAAEVAPRVLKYYEGMFGLPFPLRKVDQIGIPEFSSAAMENWGLITYQDNYLLFATNISSQQHKLKTARTIAHELAHQWFGNLVTMKWWTDLWLNEGFATYIASLGLHKVCPEQDTYNEDSLSNSLDTFNRDAEVDSHPISDPILKTAEIRRHFDVISYMKGSAVLRMMHMVMGQKGFFEGVSDYLTKHKYKNAEQDDLWAAFTEKAHELNRIQPKNDIKTIMDSWTLQSGYPLVKVSRNYETGSMEISQHRFLNNITIPDDEAKKCWWVPLSYTTASEMDFTATTPKAWLECDEFGKNVPLQLDNVTVANEWIIFNIQLSGVYRVMYDTENWRLIAGTLNSDKFTEIHLMNRVQLIHDAMSLAWIGYQGYDITFNVLEYLARELNPHPWDVALDGLALFHRLFRISPQHTTYFNAFMRYIIEPVYYNMGGLNDTLETSAIHVRVAEWACSVELEDCVQTAIKYFEQWKLSKNPDGGNNIAEDMRYCVYCTAIRHGNKDDWNFLWNHYQESNEDREKTITLMSLSCSHDETVLRDFFDLIFYKENNFSEFDVEIAFSMMCEHEIGAAIARKYCADHITSLHEKFYISDLLQLLSYNIVFTDDIDKFTKLIDSNKEYFKDSEEMVQNVFKLINTKLQWIERNLEPMGSYLQSRLSSMGILEDNVID